MSDIADLLSGGELSSIPQAVLAVLPPDEGAGALEPTESARAFALQYAAVALCENRRGGDVCPSCSCWSDGAHPDMVLAGGRWEKAPGIEECLAFQAALHLRPFAAPGRLGVVPAADAMSLPAANSLLKIVEEPPEGARLLLLAQSEDVIPTLRSRMWIWRPGGMADRIAAAAPPQSPLEWASWLERTKKFSLADLNLEVRGWVAWFSDAGEWRTAASLENLLTLAINRHIPVSMIQDATYALLREGASVEQIFGYIREA